MISLTAILAVFIAVVLGATRSGVVKPLVDGDIEGLTNVLHRGVKPADVPFRFFDATGVAGLRFRHFPAVRRSLLPEDMGSGAAWGDYNNDDAPDLFLVNFRGSILDPATEPTVEQQCALYRNNADGTFTDVTDEAGLGIALYGMGAAWGDYDNDGHLDLYISAYGRNVLYRNKGDGTFIDVTGEAAVGDEGFGAGVAWADYDRDGWLDLYVCNYVDFRVPEAEAPRAGGGEIPFTLNPSSYRPQRNVLYRNNGDGTFYDATDRAGVGNPTGRSLSAVWVDFDRDQWIDLYVANDVSDNGVFRNRGDGAFEDVGAASLAADYRGAMGLAAGDYEGDGNLDLFVTHWVAQENALFRNVSPGSSGGSGRPPIRFVEVAEPAGLGQVSLNMVGWATGFTDFDNDGMTDLWVANGHTFEEESDPRRLIGQPLHLYHHRGGAGFFEVAAVAGPPSVRSIVGRGGAAADYDGDGRVDLLVMVHGDRPVLLRNTTPRPGHWLAVGLRQDSYNTRAIGAMVTVEAGGVRRVQQVLAGGSYLSQSPDELHFGLGGATIADRIEVLWPDGTSETHRVVPADRRVVFQHRPTYGKSISE